MGRIAEALKRAEQERQVGSIPGRTEPSYAEVATIPVEPMPEARIPAPPVELPAEGDAPVALVEGLDESLVPFHDRSSLITEQYRALRTRLLSQNPLHEHRTITITSAVPKEGKSVTTLNLACILAEIRHLRVLVVDGDFRRSSLARMLNMKAPVGLADVLAGDVAYEDVIRSTPIPNLSFISAGGTHGRSAAELLTAANAREVFRRMQNDFHYTIVDTPPATTVTDVGIIGQMSSGVIMVARLNYTQESAAKSAVRLLQANNIPILGSLVIGRDAPGGRYGYGYGYYRYYRHHNYYRKSNEEEKG